VHNNYYLLRQLIPQLEKKLAGYRTETIFSQNKDELILSFNFNEEVFTIKALLEASFTCLSFPKDYRRARKNSADLFPQITGLILKGMHNYLFDRSFAMDFEENHTLIFKLYGNRSNILLFKDNVCIDIFKHNLKTDLNLRREDFDKALNLTKKKFDAIGQDYQKFLPVLGKGCRPYFRERSYNKKTPGEKWEMVSELINQLNQPVYCIFL
jgi:predicted ribosome quality control (RQC) complex YloA/Tae2 family protein